MAMNPRCQRYLNVFYSHSTDLQSIGRLAEYQFKHDAEKAVQDALNSGMEVTDIRVFKATECSISIKEATIND